MLTYGVDLQKHSFMIVTLDASGELVKRRKLPARRAHVLRYLASLQGPHQAVVEAPGGWYWIADLLSA